MKLHQSGKLMISLLIVMSLFLISVSAYTCSPLCTSGKTCMYASYGNYCAYEISKPFGASCTYDFQCLSNYCPAGTCQNSIQTNVLDGGACTFDSNCRSGWCATELDGVHKTCRQKTVLGVGSGCVNSQQCISGNCVNYKCADSVYQLPISLRDGASCIWNYQCDSNSCVSGICRPSTVVGMINGGSCSVNSNCQSAYCCTEADTGRHVCADPNANVPQSHLGEKCGVKVGCDRTARVCLSGLTCKNNECVGSTDHPETITEWFGEGIGSSIGDFISSSFAGLGWIGYVLLALAVLVLLRSLGVI